MNPANEAAISITPASAMIRTLGVVAALCGLIIVFTYQSTYQAVEQNKRIALERAVAKVIPAATSMIEYLAQPDGRIVKLAAASDAVGTRFFAGYDAAGELAGIAAEGAAKGYADYVRILFAFDPTRSQLTGFGVVSSRETPGIGDKISSDKEFLANFPLQATLSNDASRLAQPITTVKHGSKVNPWEIDAIAGATITSRAVGKAINDTAQRLLPLLAGNLQQLKEKQ